MAEAAFPRAPRRKWRRRVGRASLALAGVVLALVLAGLGYELSLPSVADAPAQVATIVRSHGGELGHLPLPTKLSEAEVAVEDEHFYSNVLLDVFDGAARAALTALHSSGDPGGSTIAQQLAKQLYPSGSPSPTPWTKSGSASSSHSATRSRGSSRCT